MAPSKFEREREANIARNRALLEQLELKQAVQDLGFPANSKPKPSNTKAKPVQPTKRIKKEKSEAEAPRRQSARLRNTVVDPDESPLKKRKREAELEEQRAKEAEERIEAEERARIAKRPRHDDLDLQTLIDEEDIQNIHSLSSELQGLAQISRAVDIPEEVESEDSKEHEQAVADLKKRMQGLKIVSRAKVTNDRVYSAAYHPDSTKDLIFFGDKHGQLGIWDARAENEAVGGEDDDAADTQEGGKYWRLQVHWPATSKSSISCIKFDPLDSHTVYTTSYDCTIRALSFTSEISREIFSSGDILLCSMDTVPTGHEIWISDASGGLTHLDLREDKSKAKWYQLSDNKIGCVSVNPTRPNFLLTASNNRSLKIWDVRKLESLPSSSSPSTSPSSSSDTTPTIDFESEVVNEFLESDKGDGCLRGEWRHDKSVSSAYWDPTGRSIVSTSYDDTIRLWQYPSSVFATNKTFPSSRPFCHIKHNCQTGKWLTILRAQWTPNPDVYPHFTIANMDHSLDIFSAKGTLISKLADRSKITAVQAVTCSHPSVIERVASGNASGRCVLWAPADD